ncbi:MAG: c-type cytochrome [Nitrososphaerales archaeon]
MSRVSRLALFVLVALLLVACSGGAATQSPSAGQSASAGNAANGDKLFHQATLGKDNVPGCVTCHSTEKDKALVGPSLAGIATDAAGAFKESGYKGTAKDAAGWLNEQIVNPNLEVVEGFQPNVMPQNYGTELSGQELNDLVAYLLTLK